MPISCCFIVFWFTQWKELNLKSAKTAISIILFMWWSFCGIYSVFAIQLMKLTTRFSNLIEYWMAFDFDRYIIDKKVIRYHAKYGNLSIVVFVILQKWSKMDEKLFYGGHLSPMVTPSAVFRMTIIDRFNCIFKS